MSEISKIESKICELTAQLENATEAERLKVINSIKNEFINKNIKLTENEKGVFHGYVSGKVTFLEFYDFISKKGGHLNYQICSNKWVKVAPCGRWDVQKARALYTYRYVQKNKLLYAK